MNPTRKQLLDKLSKAEYDCTMVNEILTKEREKNALLLIEIRRIQTLSSGFDKKSSPGCEALNLINGIAKNAINNNK